MKWGVLTALLGLLLALPAWADQPSSDKEALGKFCSGAKTTLDMNQCTHEMLQSADRELNQTYQAALRKWANYPKVVDQLRQSQRAWITYRDADIAARFADTEDTQRGTAFPSAYNAYQSGLERERTARLCEYLRGASYGERDRSSCAELAHHPFIEPSAP